MVRSLALAALAGLAASAPAAGQLAFENRGYSGEVSASGTSKTGNTQSTDLGFGFKLRYESDFWRHVANGVYDFGTAEGEETKNRLATSYEVARRLNHRLYGFGRGALELDAFDGYEYRTVLGGGFGYDIFQGDERFWSVQGGPAYRIDEVEAVFDDMGVLLAPAERQVSGALNLGSRFEAQLNDAVSVSNDTDLTASADNTTVANSAALTAGLLGSVSARFSFDVFYDAKPPFGANATDTTTRASLVYTFGAN